MTGRGVPSSLADGMHYFVMIRFRRLSIDLLNAWLVDQKHPDAYPPYRLRVWRENPDEFAAIRVELIEYVEEAFEDARRKLRRGFSNDLSPFQDSQEDPTANYPELLNRWTLQGYLGETLAVIAVEHWGAHGQTDWIVPALLFRFHDQEFQHLEAINERLRDGQSYDPDEPSERRPGRTGDDAVAFRKSNDNRITDVLVLESKCLASNHPSKIEAAFRKLSTGSFLPPGVRELINLLDEYDTHEAQSWQEALLRLWRRTHEAANRYDGIGYTCGKSPARKETNAWMPASAPNPPYTVKRCLEAMEFQMADLRGLIDSIYRRT